MQRLLVVLVFVLAVPTLSFAVPCSAGSLASYVALGATGCEIGTATIFDFSAGPSFGGGSAIDPSLITVAPTDAAIGPRLDFLLTGSVGPGEVLGVAIGYTLSGLTLSEAELSMSGADAADDGVVTVVQDICAGGTFAFDPSDCSSPPTNTLITGQDFIGYFGDDTEPLPLLSFFDVFVDITLDGGLFGSASLSAQGKVSNQYTAKAATAPEPSAILLLSTGLLALWASQRKRDS
jgi:hypothetical protein